MNTISMTVIADQLNEMAHDFAIGQLQDIRVKLHNLKNRPGTKIFGKETIFPDYAFHYGGRRELNSTLALTN